MAKQKARHWIAELHLELDDLEKKARSWCVWRFEILTHSPAGLAAVGLHPPRDTAGLPQLRAFVSWHMKKSRRGGLGAARAAQSMSEERNASFTYGFVGDHDEEVTEEELNTLIGVLSY